MTTATLLHHVAGHDQYLGLWEWDGTLARIDPSGYDAGKKVKGKKRHIVVDTLGMILAAHIQPADTQDRDGACRS